MKSVCPVLLAFVLVPSALAQPKKLSPAYSQAAIKVLEEMDDTEFHAFHYARDVAAKTAAEKLSVKRLQSFLLIHSLSLTISKSTFADDKTRLELRNQEDCASQWKTNLRYQDAKVPPVCGLKF